MKMRPIYITRRPTPSGCRSKVNAPLPAPLSAGPPSLPPYAHTSRSHHPPRRRRTGKEAGLAFERAAAIQTKNLNEPDDAANSLVEAFKVYRKTDPEDAARALQQAIAHWTGKGNFRRAATHQQNLAEMLEAEVGDQKRAIEAYATAAEWFESDNAEA